jgi:hypothetical protein
MQPCLFLREPCRQDNFEAQNQVASLSSAAGVHPFPSNALELPGLDHLARARLHEQLQPRFQGIMPRLVVFRVLLSRRAERAGSFGAGST